MAYRDIRIMPIGNSITGSFDDMTSYRYHVWQDLMAAGYEGDVDFVGILCGVDDANSVGDCGNPAYDSTVWDWNHEGWHDHRTYHLAYVDAPRAVYFNIPDIVMLMQGTNDIWEGLTADSTKNNLEITLDVFRDSNPRVVILLSKLIPMTAKPSSDSAVREFNAMIDQLAAEQDRPESRILVVDHYTDYDTNWLRSDEIHPTSEGEIHIAERFSGVLLPFLESVDSTAARLTVPSDGAMYSLGSTVDIEVHAWSTFAVNEVEIQVDGDSIGLAAAQSDTTFAFSWTPPANGVYELRAIMRDDLGQADTTETVALATVSSSVPDTLSIADIQGSAHTSPYEGELVYTDGIVTVFTADSSHFWIQGKQGSGRPARSEGIRVSTSPFAGTLPAVGDSINIIALVQEDGYESHLTVTQLCFVQSIGIHSGGHALPQALPTPSMPHTAEAMASLPDLYEKREGMRQAFFPATVVAPTNPNGSFAIIIDGNGVSGGYSSTSVTIVEPDASDSVDYQPECIVVDDWTLSSRPEVRSGDTVTDLVGVIDYANGVYRVLPQESSFAYASAGDVPVGPVSERHGILGSLSMATLDLETAFDTLDDPKDDCVMSPADYATFLAKVRTAVIEELNEPLLLCVQGIENTQVLADIANQVNSARGTGYAALSYESSDPRGLECGFLYDSSLVTLMNSKLLDGPAVDSAFGSASDKPGSEPLAGRFKYQGQPFLVVSVEFVDESTDGPLMGAQWPFPRPSEKLRAKQAHVVRDFLDDMFAGTPERFVVVAGQFHDYHFGESGEESDHPVAIIEGDAGAGEVVMENMSKHLRASSRFTGMSHGRAGMTSHILLSPSAHYRAVGTDALHFNSQFEESLASDSTTAVRSSSHDAVEVRF
ncbi:MAG: hypothetical protein GF363_11360 [Chitinivibrionales bacterium]|nr:hypothetical protein [Chitinivibrionales bacterium]